MWGWTIMCSHVEDTETDIFEFCCMHHKDQKDLPDIVK